VNLLVEPDGGVGPLLTQIKRARYTIDTTIFRFDLAEIEKALQAAVARGVKVRALVAHTNSDGEKRLRKLELRFLDLGITLARSDDDLVRYHGKMLIVDRALLTVMLFNYTRLDTARSRSFAVTTRNARLVAEASRLFEADMARQPYSPAKLTDRMMVRLLQERAKKGVEIRVLGKVGRSGGGGAEAKPAGLRLHARVIIRDGRRAFLGSQSLRQLELDARREVGLIVDDAGVLKQLMSVFESDWAAARSGKPTGARESVTIPA
jgi:cardiolipin synthase A/B